MRWARALLVVALCPSAACFYSKAEGERLQQDVYALQTQMTALQRQLAAIESQESKTSKQLASVASDVAELNTAARRNDADIGVVLDVVRQDVARMKGQVDEMSERLGEVEVTSTKTKEEVDLRFQSLAADAKIREAESAKEKAAAMKAAEQRAELLSNPKKALERADALLEKGQAAEARKLVRALEIRQGKEKGWGVYAAKAQYLIGESYFAENDFRQAAAAYNAVRKKYPKAKTWVPGSLLKLGMCFAKLGLADDAKLFYQKVAKEFPKHPAGREGKRLLGAM